MYEFLMALIALFSFAGFILLVISLVKPKIGLWWYPGDKKRGTAITVYMVGISLLMALCNICYTQTPEGKAEAAKIAAEAAKMAAEAEAEAAKIAAEAEAAEAEAAKIAAEAKAEQDKIVKEYGPEPSLNSWNGVARVIEDFLERTAKDPSSIKYGGASNLYRTTYNGTKCYLQRVDWRAKNSFGGYVRDVYEFYVKYDVVIGYTKL
jgi:hypothetical protein